MIVKASLASTAPTPPQHNATVGSTFVSNDRKRIFPAPPRPEQARYSTPDINTIGVRGRQSNYPQTRSVTERKNPRVSSLHQSHLTIIYQIITREAQGRRWGERGRSAQAGRDV